MIEVLKKSDRLVGVLVTVQRIRVRPFPGQTKDCKIGVDCFLTIWFGD